MQTPCASSVSLPQPITLTSGLLRNSHKAEGDCSQDFVLRSFGLICSFKPPHMHLLCLVVLHPICLPLSPISKFLAHFSSEVFGFAAFTTRPVELVIWRMTKEVRSEAAALSDSTSPAQENKWVSRDNTGIYERGFSTLPEFFPGIANKLDLSTLRTAWRFSWHFFLTPLFVLTCYLPAAEASLLNGECNKREQWKVAFQSDKDAAL